MKDRLFFLISVFSIFVAAACTKTAPDPKSQIIARVNGEPVFLPEFLVNFQQLKSEQDEISQKNPKLIEQLKTRALNEAIVMNLLRQEAAKTQVRIAKEEVEGRLANWKDSYFPGGFEEMLRKRNTSEDYLKKRIEDQLLVEKVSSQLFAAETLVSDEEIKNYFKIHESELYRPEKVHVFQIVVPTKEEAEKIRQEVISGKTTFESAARQYSLSPDATKGGDLGFFAKNEKIAAFNEAFSLTVGSISRPIQSRYGIHLLKVVEKQTSKKLNFNEAKNDIVSRLKRVKEVKIYKEWATKLLKDGEIYRNEVLFTSIT
jgi:parvulin-like peptidyl-prolyl isomerase